MRGNRALVQRQLLRGVIVAAMAWAGLPRAGSAQDRRPSGWAPQAGVWIGSPQRASLGVGMMRVLERSPDFSFASGVRLLGEPGLRAGKIRLGYAVTGPFASGYSIEAAAMREWSEHVQAGFPRNFYGVEVHGSVMFIDLGLGLYAPGGGSRGRVALSAGLVL